jgi:FixJ family two-component response regulator
MTGHARVPMAVRAFKGGAIDFIRKPFSDQSLLERIRWAIDLDRRTREVRIECAKFAALLADLTPREREVMNLVISGKPNKIIAADLGISPKTWRFIAVVSWRRAGLCRGLVRLDLLWRPTTRRRPLLD